MQLLKLVSTYNTTPNQGIKPNPKNHYLNILENCVHVPKDDKLIIRKYLTGLKSFDQNNEILAILAKNSKKGKQNVDKKLEVLLRKCAEKIRKQEQRHMVTKVYELKPKISIPQAAINARKYCNNFQLLKRNLRIPSSKKSGSKSNEHSLNSSSKKLNSILQSTSPKNINSRDYSSTRTLKQLKPRERFELLNKPLFKLYQTNRTCSQESKDRKKPEKGFGKKAAKQTGGTKIYKQVEFFEQEPSKHKHTRSRSLGDLIQNIPNIPNQNYESLPNDGQVQMHVFEPVNHSYENQQFSSFGNIQTETQSAQNTSRSNFQQPINDITPASQTMSSFFTQPQYNTKSVHLQLKELKLCSEEFLDFLIPISIKQSRSPSDLSFLYSDFIKKLNEFIESNTSQKSVCSAQTVYIPFHTQYDLVTFQKFSQFLDEYMTPKLECNPVRDLYTRIEAGVCGTLLSIFNHKRINVSEFKKCYQWNKNTIQKFQQLVRRCSRWGTCLTYWQLYWLKDSQEFSEFQKQFSL